jgi:predicted glycosyltransferase
VGGGQDGGPLVRAFAEAELPEGMYGIIVTGPFLPADVRRSVAARAVRDERLRMLPFIPEPVDLLRCCERVVAMGGYNTLSEILSFEKPSLVVPRVSPRREQWIRARRFSELGLLDLLPPERLSAEALGDWLAREVKPPEGVRRRVDFEGLSRIPDMLHEVLDRPWRGRSPAPLYAPRTA